MKAMVLSSYAPVESSPLAYRDVPDPHPGPAQVRVRIHACAVCRTDLHVIEKELPPAKLPIIPGHQAVGVVDELGPGCKHLRLGQRVGIAWLGHTCGQCTYCARGQENLCEHSRYTGYHLDGGYAQYALVHEDFAYVLPETFSDIEVTPLLCAGIIGYRALQRSAVPAGGTLGVYGFGSSAHIVMQLAKHRGCKVYAVSRAASHQELARQLGAVWAGGTPQELPVKVDGAILFAPVGSLVPPALEKLEKGGTLAVAGIYVSEIPALDYQRHLFFEKCLCSVTANTREDGRALLAEAAAVPIRPHVTTYPLAQANEALQDMKADRINGTGVLVMP